MPSALRHCHREKWMLRNRPTGRKLTMKTLTIIAGAMLTALAGATLFVLGITAVATIRTMQGQAKQIGENQRPANQAGVKDKPSIRKSRMDMATDLTGKTKAEVRALIGQPHTTTDFDTRSAWHYKDRTIDKETGKVDRFLFVYFKGDVVESIACNP